MNVRKEKDGSKLLLITEADKAKLRKGWEALEELAHFGRNDDLPGLSGTFSSEFLDKLANDVGAIVNWAHPKTEKSEAADGN